MQKTRSSCGDGHDRQGVTGVVLGIDAAWTEGEPSGVAVVRATGSGWRCLGVAPSYESFISLARGEPIDWREPGRGAVPSADALLEAARALAGADVDLVAIDMPISTTAISGRRAADNAISTEFGTRWCSAHSPNAQRPGRLGHSLSTAFQRLGYEIATVGTAPGTLSRLVEVYPHPALLGLLGRDVRIPYKVGKANRYWPGRSVSERVALLLEEFAQIHLALTRYLGPFALPLPVAREVSSLSQLKRFEDALDSLICCWVGALYSTGGAIGLGDSSSAIWCPRSVCRAAT